jgi:hypothetical protein
MTLKPILKPSPESTTVPTGLPLSSISSHLQQRLEHLGILPDHRITQILHQKNLIGEWIAEVLV